MMGSEREEGDSPPQMNRVLSFSNGIACIHTMADESIHSSYSTDCDTFSFAIHSKAEEDEIDSGYHPNREDDDPTADKKSDFQDLIDEINANDDDDPLLKTVLSTLLYVLVWYIFSTCLTLYNKKLLGRKYGKFPAPLLMNTIHFSMQAIVSTLLLRFCVPSLNPNVSMSWRDYFVRVIPTGVATALDVDLTNASLVFISITFATMCKSSTPVFILIFAFLFKLESPSIKLFGIIFIISCGVLLTVATEDSGTQFNLFGFVLVMLAALSSGFRWVVTQLLLQKKEYGLTNPLAAMSYFTPVMAVVTLIFSLILEPWGMLGKSPYFDTRAHIMESFALMLLGGTLAFFMVMAEYLLISKTSAVTLTVAGVVKEFVTVVVGILYFHDEFTVLKGVGFIVIVIGVSLYNWFKYQTLVEGRGKHRVEGIEIGSKGAKYTILEEENGEDRLHSV